MRSLNEPGSPSAPFTTTAVGVDGRLVRGDGLPLPTRREPGTAAAPQTGATTVAIVSSGVPARAPCQPAPAAHGDVGIEVFDRIRRPGRDGNAASVLIGRKVSGRGERKRPTALRRPAAEPALTHARRDDRDGQQDDDDAERDRRRDVPPVRHGHLRPDEDQDEPKPVTEVVQAVLPARQQEVRGPQPEDRERVRRRTRGTAPG